MSAGLTVKPCVRIQYYVIVKAWLFIHLEALCVRLPDVTGRLPATYIFVGAPVRREWSSAMFEVPKPPIRVFVAARDLSI
jgi:hypothetical protein